MKKFSLLGIMLLFLFSTVRSQEIVIKPSIGGNLTNLSRDSYANKYSPRGGFQAGVSAAIGNRFYVEPGLFYVNRQPGYTAYMIIPLYMTNNIQAPLPNMYLGNRKEATVHLTGIQVPLSIGYRLIDRQNTRSKFGLRAFAGAAAFFPKSSDVIAGLQNPQWSVFGGAGIDYGCFFVESKYEWTLSHLQSEHTYVDRGKLRSVYLNLGVRVPVKKR